MNVDVMAAISSLILVFLFFAYIFRLKDKHDQRN